MANQMFLAGIENVIKGNVAWNINEQLAILVDLNAYTPNFTTHSVLADIPVAARVAQTTLLNRTVGVSSRGAADSDNAYFTNVTGPEAEALVIVTRVADGLGNTDDTQSMLVVYIDDAAALPFLPNGSDYEMEFSTDGIWRFVDAQAQVIA